MHEDQVSIDLATVRSLIRDQFPVLANEPVRRLPTNGTVNAIFRIGDRHAARFPLRSEAPATRVESLRSEAAAMTEMAQHCRFPTPTPVFVGCSGNSYPMPWTIQTWISGDVATPTGLAASTLLADDLVLLIEALRATETRGRTFSGEGRGGDLPDHDNWMNHCFQESEGLLDVARLRMTWDRLRELPAAGDDVMSHCDLTPANLLVDGEHLVGVIDGGGFSPADPSLDLVAAWHLLDRDARQAVRNGLDCSYNEWRRGAAWAFQQAMGLVWYYQHTNPGMAALGRTTLQRILNDIEIQAL